VAAATQRLVFIAFDSRQRPGTSRPADRRSPIFTPPGRA
jgi:hypothetical protein